jgi:hypothetical protein
VVLEKNGEDFWTNYVRNAEILSQGGEEYLAYNKKKEG